MTSAVAAISLNARRAGLGLLGAALIASTTVAPAEAARKTVFSSSGSFGISACQYTKNRSVKFTVQNYTSTPIYKVTAKTSSGSGTYVQYIPGYYGNRTQQYAQIIPDGYRYVYVQWSSSSSQRYKGRFYLKKSSLPMCSA